MVYRLILRNPFSCVLSKCACKIQPKTFDLSTRLWGITTEFVGLIPKRLVLRSMVLG